MLTVTDADNGNGSRRGVAASLKDQVPAQRLVVFRVALGLLLAAAAMRYLAYGWPRTLLSEPRFHFKYALAPLVEPLPPIPMSLLFVVMAVLALAWAFGRGGALTLGAYLIAFVYVEIIDKALYLNHYYLVSLLVGMLCFSSCAGVRWSERHAATVPRWELWAFRMQVSLVYFYAGLWKLNTDWLLRAEPLSSWLWRFRTLPLVGPIMIADATPYIMSWGGAAFDLGIWALLLWRRSARPAYALCIAFHLTLWLLFPIGVFSFVMILAAGLLLPTAAGAPSCQPRPRVRRPWVAAVFATHLVLQLALPWRFLTTGPDVNWHEDGYRFAWRVMLNEKLADVEMVLVRPDGQRTALPIHDLTPLQSRQMGYQADMLLEYAHSRCAEQRRDGHTPPDIRIDARVAHNGRRAEPYIRDINLCTAESSALIVRRRRQAPANRQ